MQKEMEQQLVGLPFSLVIFEQMVFVGREIEFRCKKKEKNNNKKLESSMYWDIFQWIWLLKKAQSKLVI